MQPIHITAINTTDSIKEVNLFSFNDKNEGIEFKTISDNLLYEFIRNRLYGKQWEVASIFINADDNSLLDKIITAKTIDEYGNESSKPFPLIESFDLNQLQECCVEIKGKTKFSYGHSIMFKLNPKEHITVNLLRDPFVPPTKTKYKLVESIKTQNVNTSEETTLQPSWDMGITHIRTVGFCPETILVGGIEIKSESDCAGIFKVSAETHTPMKIKIPEGTKGYILFYREIVE